MRMVRSVLWQFNAELSALSRQLSARSGGDSLAVALIVCAERMARRRPMGKRFAGDIFPSQPVQNAINIEPATTCERRRGRHLHVVATSAADGTAEQVVGTLRRAVTRLAERGISSSRRTARRSVPATVSRDVCGQSSQCSVFSFQFGGQERD